MHETKTLLVLIGSLAVACTGLSQEAKKSESEWEKWKPCGWSARWKHPNATKPVALNPKKYFPKKLKDVRIEWPDSDVEHSGLPIVGAVIGLDGSIKDFKFIVQPVFEPPWPEAEEAIENAIKKWRYESPVVNGKPTPVCMTVTVHIAWQ